MLFPRVNVQYRMNSSFELLSDLHHLGPGPNQSWLYSKIIVISGFSCNYYFLISETETYA
jgi:hypothetical protein